jgi:predicted RNA-binding Zn-ribbon protein involved in translation (DUF1610 family)
MHKSSFYGHLIRATGQGYKMTLSMCVTVIGFAFLLFAQVHSAYLLEPVACLVLFAGFFGGPLAVSCPQCGSRFIWRAMRAQSISTWTDIFAATHCPQCRFSPPDTEA